MTTQSNILLDSLDLGGAVQRAEAGLSGLRGTEALTLGAGLLLLDIPLWATAWRYDFQPTIQATTAFSADILSALPPGALPYASFVALLFTLLPMLGEFCLPRLASAGVRVAALAVYGLSLFDAYTDWPNVAATMDRLRSGFDGFGLLALPIWWLARLLFLFMATHGLELLAVVALICAVRLLKQSRGGGAHMMTR